MGHAKSSRADSENDKFHEWAEEKHGSEELGYAEVNRGRKHDYLCMILDWTKNNHASAGIVSYQEAIDEKFLEEIKPNSEAPRDGALLNIDDNSL